MRRTGFIILCIVAAVALWGCGGGSVGPASPVSPKSGSGRATLVIKWPQPTRLIPLACNSIKLEIMRGTDKVAEQIAARPANGTESTVTFPNLPVGDLTLLASAYPNSDGTGVAQASGAEALPIQDGKDTEVTLVMASTIDHLSILPASPSLPVGVTAQLVLSAHNASGEVVLFSASKINWTSSALSVAEVDANGAVTSKAVGTADITATDIESGRAVTATVTVRSGLQYGDLVDGTIGFGELDQYAFIGAPGDVVTVIMTETAPYYFFSRIDLFAPDGSLVVSVQDQSPGYAPSGTGVVGIENRALAQAGVYTIVCRDRAGNSAGQYRVSLHRLFGNSDQGMDPEGGPIAYGESKSGTITMADLDIYTFPAAAGDKVTAVMVETAPYYFFSRIDLFAPDGSLVASVQDQSPGYAPSATGVVSIENQQLTQAGTYTLVCRDRAGNSAGQYKVTLSKIGS